MSLNSNALINNDYFDFLWDGESIDPQQLIVYINFVSQKFENFCNRSLVEKAYTYDSDEEDLDSGVYYLLEYTIFDAPRSNIFWFPTYPVSEITYFSISGTEISAAESTDYTANDGYLLYKNTGKLIYSGCFDYPYLQNIKIKWKGGYASTSAELIELKYLCYLTIKDVINAPESSIFKSEKFSQYAYTRFSSESEKALQGLSPNVFSELKIKFRKEIVT